MALDQDFSEKLKEIKTHVKDTYIYFRDNYNRYHEFRKYVFDTTLTDQDQSALAAVNKPVLEVNIMEAYVSRLCGEFSKQEPSIIVMADDGLNIDPQVISTVENHIRHIMFESKSNGIEYEVYKDLLSGGFSVFKCYTEYAHNMSFNQVIKVGRATDPTLCGFDPMANLPSKSDGRFCFELFPKTKKEFEREYPDISTKDLSFTRQIEGFNWSYRNDREEILLICDWYEKKKRPEKIVQLVDGSVMTMKEYKQFLKDWEEEGNIAEPPAMMGKPRTTEMEIICRYRMIENKIIEYVETDYPSFPLIFVDGNSAMIRKATSGAMVQMTRPYIYNCKGIQKLKNCAAQNLANELEMLVQHKFKVAKESLPDEQEYLRAYTDIQTANTIVYNAFMDNDPQKPVPPPAEIVRPQIPPEITQTFMAADQTMQVILGSYDASLGINDNQLSGVAIVEAATQSNGAAMPYVVGYLQALTAVANLVVDLIPKYYITPRTIPIVHKDGSRGFQRINDQNRQQQTQSQMSPNQLTPQQAQQQQMNQASVDLNYDSNSLQVKVEAGVNFAIQKNRALQQIIALMQADPGWAQFIVAKGLPVILDNLEIRGVDQLKELAGEYMQEMKQQQQMQQQMQQQALQNNPQIMKAQNEKMRTQIDAQEIQQNSQIKTQELALKSKQIDNDIIKLMNDIEESRQGFSAQMAKAEAEKIRAVADMVDMKHQHNMDHMNMVHEMHKTQQEHDLKKSQGKSHE